MQQQGLWVCWALIVDHLVAASGPRRWASLLRGVKLWRERWTRDSPTKTISERDFREGPAQLSREGSVCLAGMFLKEQVSFVNREGGASLMFRIWGPRAAAPVTRNPALGGNHARPLQRAATPRIWTQHTPPQAGASGKLSPSRWSLCWEEAVWRGRMFWGGIISNVVLFKTAPALGSFCGRWGWGAALFHQNQGECCEVWRFSEVGMLFTEGAAYHKNGGDGILKKPPIPAWSWGCLP